jgi:hypothetical protein
MRTLLLAMLLSLSACSGTSKSVSVAVVSTPLPPDAKIEVLGNNQAMPTNARYLGSVKIGDDTMTAGKNCTYDRVISDAQEQARAMGGNVLQIKKHIEPNIWSTCHRLVCDVYLSR